MNKPEATTVPEKNFKVRRVQLNLIAKSERKLLTFLASRLPAWVTPDLLTGVSVAGACLVLAFEIASRGQRSFLWLASAAIVVNWFGDSLDGSLARYRKIERPQYGYFLDHTVDALCNFMIMLGFGLSQDIRLDVSFFALIGYFLLCMYVFINNHISGTMRLSFIGFGPTELRICLVLINTAMFFWGRAGMTVWGQFFSYYDFVLLFAGIMFVAVYVFQVAKGVHALRGADTGVISRQGP